MTAEDDVKKSLDPDAPDNVVNLSERRTSDKKKKKDKGGKGGGKGSGGGVRKSPDDEPCPVACLGKGEDGKSHHYLTVNKQLLTYKDREHGPAGLDNLFAGGGQAWLEACFPKLDRDGNVLSGYNSASARKWLFDQSAARGIWSPFRHLRGVGAWLGADKKLIWHKGDALMCAGMGDTATAYESRPVGMVGNEVYPAAEPTLAPLEAKLDGAYMGDAPGADLLDILTTWKWQRDTLDIDARLMLGWIGCGFLSGALKWRPAVWLTGDKGTGKSTLQELVSQLYGGFMVSTTDTTAAGLWQTLGYDARPIGVDEIESTNRRASGIIDLARAAASGGVILRGGADHQSSQFYARSCFLFSSILIPPLPPSTLSRLAILNLDPLGNSKPRSPLWTEKILAAMGARLLDDVLRHYDKFTALLDAWRDGLKAVGHDDRGADQFGTLMAAHDLLLSYGEIDTSWIKQCADVLNPNDLAETSESEANWKMCIDHLANSTLDQYSQGGRSMVSTLIYKAYGADVEGHAAAQLAKIGIKVLGDVNPGLVAIAPSHSGLIPLFKDTPWKSEAGTRSPLAQALARVPGAQAGKEGRVVKIDKRAMRCTVLPLKFFIEIEEMEGDPF